MGELKIIWLIIRHSAGSSNRRPTVNHVETPADGFRLALL